MILDEEFGEIKYKKKSLSTNPSYIINIRKKCIYF